MTICHLFHCGRAFTPGISSLARHEKDQKSDEKTYSHRTPSRDLQTEDQVLGSEHNIYGSQKESNPGLMADILQAELKHKCIVDPTNVAVTTLQERRRKLLHSKQIHSERDALGNPLNHAGYAMGLKKASCTIHCSSTRARIDDA